MRSVVSAYVGLMNRFLQGELRAEDFQIVYLEKFKNEASDLEPEAFALLDQLFVDVDAFEADPKLLAGLRADAPLVEYLNEQELRSRVSEVLSGLSR